MRRALRQDLWWRSLQGFGRGLALLGAALIAYGLWLLGDTGGYEPLPVVAPLSCATIGSRIGITDAVADPATGLVYLGGFDSRAARAGEPGRGGLYALDLRAAAPALRDITPPALDHLRPAGLGLFRQPDGALLLFAVDRQPAGAKIIILDAAGITLTHRATISDPAFRSVNDIAPVGPRQFYASNDHEAPMGLGRALESLLGLPRADIVYFDGTLTDAVAPGLTGPRGLAISADGRILYAAEGMRHRIRVYARDDATGALREERRLALRAMPDKISLDGAGRLWIAAQPRLIRLLLHFIAPRFSAPSLIGRLDPGLGLMTPVYVDDGTTIADARVALAAEGKLLIAASLEPKILLCNLS